MQDWEGPLFDGVMATKDRAIGTGFQIRKARTCDLRGIAGYRLSEFNATPGEEEGGYLTDADKDVMLSAAGVPTPPPSEPLSDAP